MSEISIKRIAETLGISKDYALRLVKRRKDELGITPVYKQRNAVFLSREDADLLIANYEPRRSASETSAAISSKSGFGFFYVIQLHPDDLPSRLKIGYSESIQVRLSDHRTTAPTLQLLGKWPCKRVWEDAARASITRDSCQHIGGEVYDGEPEQFIRRASAFFELMPKPQSDV